MEIFYYNKIEQRIEKLNEIFPETLLNIVENSSIIEDGYYKRQDNEQSATKSIDVFIPSLGISLSHYFCYFGLIDQL